MEAIPEEALGPAAAELGWGLEAGELVRVVRFPDFAAALAYVNVVGALAESVGHHPDIELRWDTVTLRLKTHSAGRITDYDLDLARRINALPETAAG